MNRDLVSVIIPAFNAAEYLDECIDSVIKQTYKRLEIIIVNDGSTDNTLEIMGKYESFDSRIVAITQDNKGLGPARNTGLEHATGVAIMFLDADDYFAPDLVNTVLDELKTNECDIVIFNGKAFLDDDVAISVSDKSYFSLSTLDDRVIRTGIEFLKITKGRIQQACFKIYRKDFIDRHNLKFPEIRYLEDTVFMYDAFIIAQRMSYVDYLGYYRRYRKDSIMTSPGIENIISRINNFHLLLPLPEKAQNPEDRRMILKQHAYYAGLLWIMAYNRRDSAERQILDDTYRKEQLDKVIASCKTDFTLLLVHVFSSLPKCMTVIKIIAARTAKLLLRGRTRFAI